MIIIATGTYGDTCKKMTEQQVIKSSGNGYQFWQILDEKKFKITYSSYKECSYLKNPLFSAFNRYRQEGGQVKPIY